MARNKLLTYLLGDKVFGKFLAKNLAEAVLVPFEATPPN